MKIEIPDYSNAILCGKVTGGSYSVEAPDNSLIIVGDSKEKDIVMIERKSFNRFLKNNGFSPIETWTPNH